jgi:hypothetical protein
MHEMDKVKRHISAARWGAVRVAFARVVQYRALAQKDPAKAVYRDAAQDVLLELLAPLTKKERKVVEGAITAVTDDNLEWATDRMIFDLRISL